MSMLIQCIRRIMEPVDHEGVFQFWLSLTLTYIRSSSLVLRLFAWEQMTDLIDVARRARPHARYVMTASCAHDCLGFWEEVGYLSLLVVAGGFW